MAMATPTKEMSIGEFDERTGLTLITRQRGRLMFNMGPPSTKRAAATAAVAEGDGDGTAPRDRSGTTSGDAPTPRPPQAPQRVFRSGAFTGRSLYAEETVYLAQRGALVVYAMEELDGQRDAGSDPAEATAWREPLTLAQLTALVVRRQFATLAALDVYAFVKDKKLHPRRSTAPEPLASRLAVFDVFKTVTETQYVRVEPSSVARKAEEGTVGLADSSAPEEEPVKLHKRKVKRLALIFRVAVSAFRDASPRPRELRRLMSGMAAWQLDDVQDDGHEPERRDHPQHCVPLKLAVADVDRSVLLFEVA